mmetsp:Transcript_106557/g.306464  ORF Transcript_106557/g.306464 Transcript_106557/m.306464 type:complete len:242 (-) Transcript_106557:21-746(-)
MGGLPLNVPLVHARIQTVVVALVARHVARLFRRAQLAIAVGVEGTMEPAAGLHEAGALAIDVLPLCAGRIGHVVDAALAANALDHLRLVLRDHTSPPKLDGAAAAAGLRRHRRRQVAPVRSVHGPHWHVHRGAPTAAPKVAVAKLASPIDGEGAQLPAARSQQAVTPGVDGLHPVAHWHRRFILSGNEPLKPLLGAASGEQIQVASARGGGRAEKAGAKEGGLGRGSARHLFDGGSGRWVC